MAKTDVWALPKPERPADTITLTDKQSGASFTFTLRAPDGTESATATERAEQLIKDYITGDEELGREAAAFPDPEVKISRSLLMQCALIRQMQNGNPLDETYDEMELAVLSQRAPGVWMQLQQATNRLIQRWSKTRGK